MDTESMIIHGAATVAAGIGAGLAQLPGADAPALISVQAAMILALADHHGVSIGLTAVMEMILPYLATMAGRFAAVQVLRVVPGAGNAANAAVAASVTEAIGWAAARAFRQGS